MTTTAPTASQIAATLSALVTSTNGYLLVRDRIDSEVRRYITRYLSLADGPLQELPRFELRSELAEQEYGYRQEIADRLDTLRPAMRAAKPLVESGVDDPGAFITDAGVTLQQLGNSIEKDRYCLDVMLENQAPSTVCIRNFDEFNADTGRTTAKIRELLPKVVALIEVFAAVPAASPASPAVEPPLDQKPGVELRRHTDPERQTDALLESSLVVDAECLEVRWHNKRCELGNHTRRFKIIERLAQRPGARVSCSKLITHAWDEAAVIEPEAVATEVKRLKQDLKKSDMIPVAKAIHQQTIDSERHWYLDPDV